MRIEALCLTLCLSLALVAAHPSGLECGNDTTTRLSVGQTIMGNKVVAAPADAPVKLSINGDDVTVTAPAGTYFALKAFGDGAKLTLSDKEAHMAPSKNCTNQIYTNTTSTTYTLKQHGATRLVVGYNIGANSGSAPTVALVSAGSPPPPPSPSIPPTPAPSPMTPDSGAITMPDTGVMLSIVALPESDDVMVHMRWVKSSRRASAAGSGWFGVGFGSGAAQMKGYAVVVDNTGAVHEQSLAEEGDPGPELPSMVRNLTSTIRDNVWEVKFLRSAVGANPQYTSLDQDSLMNGIDVSSAIGKTNWPSIHYKTQLGKIAIGGSSSSSAFDPRPYYTAHGVLMTLCFAVLLPFGVLVALYKDKFKQGLWFQIHRAVQTLGCCAALAGFIVIIVCYNKQKKDHFAITHAKVGIAVTIMTLLQPINALVRPHTPKEGEPASLTRIAWSFLHKKIGYAAIIAAWANIIFAFKLEAIHPDDYNTLVTCLEIVFYMFGGVYLLWGAYLGIMGEQEKEHAKLNQPFKYQDANIDNNDLHSGLQGP